MKLIKRGACAVLLLAGAAGAEVIPFRVFEHGNAPTEGIALSVELVRQGSAVDVTFHNQSTIDAVVTAVYLESTASSALMLSSPEILPPLPGVAFEGPANPPNPPGSMAASGRPWEGNLHSAHAAAPRPHNGIGPGESLTVRYQLNGTIEALAAAIREGDIRLAEHVQAMPGGASAWTVTIPSPGAAALAFLALGVACGPRRRR